MSTNRPKHWAAMGEHTFVFGIWLLFWVHRFLGRTPFRVCVYPVVVCHWLFRPALRTHSLQYLNRLQAATGALGRPVSRRDSLRHVLMFAETMLDKLLAASGRYEFDSIKSEGGSEVYQAALAGQGGIIVTAHIGCLELCREASKRFDGFVLNALVHTAHAEQFNRVLKRLNPNNDVNLIEVTEITPATAVLLSEKVAKGEYIAIAGDRVPVFASKTVEANFLGHAAPFPVGPWVLASLLKCPVYMMGCLHEGNGYRIFFEKIADCVTLPRAQRESSIAAYAQRYADALTGLLQRSPFDWFNFFPFWDQTHAALHTQS